MKTEQLRKKIQWMSITFVVIISFLWAFSDITASAVIISIEPAGGFSDEDRTFISSMHVTGGDRERIAKIFAKHFRVETSATRMEYKWCIAIDSGHKIHIKDIPHPFYKMDIYQTGMIKVIPNPNMDIPNSHLKKLGDAIYLAHKDE